MLKLRSTVLRADDAYIVGEIYTLQDFKVSDSLLRKDLFP